MVDYILKGGRIIDPYNNVDSIMDILIVDNKINCIDKNIAIKNTQKVIDVSGKIVTPGLIDFHTHTYWEVIPMCINANEIGPKTGVTSFVDAGSSGAGNFLGFKDYVIKNSICNMFAFINISYAGIPYVSKYMNFSENESLEKLNISSLVAISKKYPKDIKGIKVRLGFKGSGKSGINPLFFALKAAEITNLPLMVHIGDPPPTIRQIFSYLKKGDIVTHSFRGGANKLLNSNGDISTELLEARERGILVDIGHGKGSFSFKTAQEMINKKFYPDIISTDLHLLSVDKVINLPTVMSKFINLGMPLLDVIYACTYAPASAIGEERNIGQLQIGNCADIAVFELKNGKYNFCDSYGQKLIGDNRIVPVMTFKNGKIIYKSSF